MTAETAASPVAVPELNGTGPGELGREQPHDIAAEQATLGAMMLDTTIAAAISETLSAADFYRPAHQSVYAAITHLHDNDQPTDPVSVAAHLTATGLIAKIGGGPYLHTLYAAPPTAANGPHYARIVAERAVLRRLVEAGTRITQLGQSGATGDDLDQIVDRGNLAMYTVTERLDLIGGTRPGAHRGRNIDEFLNTADDDYDWVIPGLLERHDRILLTGQEGKGKSTFARQLAIMGAAGIHPFTGEVAEPIRVLYLDLENSERQSRRKLRPLRIQAGDQLDPTHLTIEIRPSGIDLLTATDRAWLDQLVHHARPDLLITGPIYRMAGGDPVEEKTAKAVSAALDHVRAQGCAVFVETHSPHATGGGKRPERPYGASLWMRWPEFGIHLADNGQLRHWRGARDEREWPAGLKRGGQWPWTPVTDHYEQTWFRIIQCREEFAVEMSVRELGDALGVDKNLIHRVLSRHKDEWQHINGTSE